MNRRDYEYDDRYQYDDSRGNGRSRNRRGFASMDPEEHREISRRGGYASHGGYDSQGSRYGDQEYDDYSESGSQGAEHYRYERPYSGSEYGRESGRGWHGDPEGHSEASERGWQSRRGNGNYDDDRYESHRGRSYDDDYRGSNSGYRGSSTGYGGSSSAYGDERNAWRSRSPYNYGRGEYRSGSGRRGFAGMDPEEQREIASMGGRAAHRSGRAHEFTSAEARRAAEERWS